MADKHIFITGGTGFIGQALCAWLHERGYRVTVLSRKKEEQVRQLCGPQVRSISKLSELHHIGAIDAVVNLAGESMLSGRWTELRKTELRMSRISLTRELCHYLAKLTHKPSVLISGSAIGYYGNAGAEELTEESPPGMDFASQLCADWEHAAREAELLRIRVCAIRIGIVLSPEGGMLSRIIMPFRLGLGGIIGDGRQWMSWIERHDLCRLITFLIETPRAQGPVNAVAPYPATNRAFTHLLAETLRRPTLLPIPAKLLALILGEAASLVLGSQHVIPEKAMALGFRFQHESLESAFSAWYS
ncbi:conserved hypothetical protein [gamma proteobacterium HdN1]|nr:conserved hypothetical protein [gamma proteobacterium HdN1]